MNARQLRWIAIGVAVLLLAWGTSELLTRHGDTTTAAFALPSLAAADVDTVAITRGPDSVLLVRQAPATWTVNGQPAAAAAVADLFAALHDSTPPELAAQSSTSFARMGVDSAGAHLLRVVAHGRAPFTLFVGAHGTGPEAVYLRLPGDPHVYLCAGRLGSLVERAIDDWRDHEVAALSPDSVFELEITRARRSTFVQRHGAKWALAGGSPADSGAVARLLEQFRSLKAAGFATARQTDSLRFEHPTRRVLLRGSGGRALVALAFDSTPSGYFARRESGGPVYRLDAWQADELTPLASALAPAQPPAPPAAASRKKPS